MCMNLKPEVTKRLRNDRGWSQQHLADICNVNLRTIQRLENSHTCSLETLNALLSAFEVERNVLESEEQKSTKKKESKKETATKWWQSLTFDKVLYYFSISGVSVFLFAYFVLYNKVISIADEKSYKAVIGNVTFGTKEALDNASGSVEISVSFFISIVFFVIALFGLVKKNQYVTLFSAISLPLLYIYTNLDKATLTPVALLIAGLIGYVLVNNSFYIKSLSKKSLLKD